MPPPSALENFEKLLAAGKDSALLRFSLGNEHLKAGDAPRAAAHLARAVALDPDFTAAWKLYGKALATAGRDAEAVAAYNTGIAVAGKPGPGAIVSTPRLARASARSLPGWPL